MLNIFLFLIAFSLSLNELIPDKNNAILITEYEIKCPSYGSSTYKITYKINNYQNKKYFQLIKNTLIREFDLYMEDSKLSYQTNTDYDYFYPITSNNTLYLVVNHFSSFCISFKFVDSNFISLKNNEEYIYPVVISNQYIKARIEDVENKHCIFYLTHTYTNQNAGYGIEYNGISYNIYPGTKIFSLLPKENDIEIKIKLPGEKIIATLRYLSIPYSNITDDTIKCISDSKSIQSFFINRSKKYHWYYWYFLSDNKIEYYDDGNLQSELSKINRNNNYKIERFFLLKEKGCFQLKYTNSSYTTNVEINDKDSFLVLNSETYKFMITESNLKRYKYMNMTIYSSENNFINKIKIKNSYQNELIIKNNNNSYFYNFDFYIDSYPTNFDINFNLNSKENIIVYFEMKELLPPKEKNNNKGNYVILGIVMGFFFIIFVCVICRIAPVIYEKYKNKKENEQKLLGKIKQEELMADFCKQIWEDYEKINKVCLLCFNEKNYSRMNSLGDININFDDEYFLDYNKSNTNYIINDINNGTFTNFIEYITPKKCPHLYHKKCGNPPQKCLLCQAFITSKNVKNFGFFFSKKILFEILKYRSVINYKIDILEKMKSILYSEIEKSQKIKKNYKNNLMKIKDMNQKFRQNFYKDSFKYFDLNINEDLTDIEIELNNKIREKEEKRRQRRDYELSERNYEDQNKDEDENDFYERKSPQIIYNNNNNKKYYKNEPKKNNSSYSSVRFCKECSLSRCPFCRGKKKNDGSFIIQAHNSCLPKNYYNNCFTCNRSIQGLCPKTSYCCRDCSILYKEIRKICPICRTEMF